MNNYFDDFNTLPQNKIIKDMRKYAKANKVPIINDEGLVFILTLLNLIKPKKFLEIGTAIGFCSICAAFESEDLIIDTIERDKTMYEEAIKNIKLSKLDNRINIHFGDALDFDLNKLNLNYDIIFIDAAKAQYIKFFEKYEPLLATEGIIITDNLLFHGLVANKSSVENKNLRELVTKIDTFNYWLRKNKYFTTSFFNIGDGMSISKRVNRK